MPSIERDSPVPRYFQLTQILISKIRKMKQGDRLPSIVQLKEEYQLSQATIDSALTLLNKEGFIKIELGMGTFVRDPYADRKHKDNIRKGTFLIGLVIPRVYGSILGEIAESIEKKAHQRGYHVILCNSHDDPKKEAIHFKRLLEKKVDGIIAFPAHLSYSLKNIKWLQGSKIPFTLLCHMCGIYADYAEDDKVQGAYSAIKHLIDLGHKRIAFIGGEFDVAFPDRFEGYKKALAEHDLESDKSLLRLSPSIWTENVPGLVKSLVETDPRPTAVFGLNDKTAIKIIQALTELGLKVPEDMAVVGYDNLPRSHLNKISLTTVSTPRDRIGEKAMEILIDKITGKTKENMTVKFKPRLIIRESSEGNIVKKEEKR